MNKTKMFIRKHKWKIAIVFTVFYVLFGFISTKFLEEGVKYDFSNWISIIVWYFVIMNSIFHEPKIKIIEIYFKSEAFSEIEQLIYKNGFVKHKETSKKFSYKQKIKWWKIDRIGVTKNNNGIWSVNGKENYIKEMEKFMVKYKQF